VSCTDNLAKKKNMGISGFRIDPNVNCRPQHFLDESNCTRMLQEFLEWKHVFSYLILIPLQLFSIWNVMLV